MRALTLTILLATLGLAGCLGDDASTQGLPVVEPVKKTVEALFNASVPWALDGSVATPVAGVNGGALLGGSNGGRVMVPGNATNLTAVAEGSCQPEPTCSLALVAYLNDEVEAFVEGPLPLTLEIADPAAGAWAFHVFADGNGAAVAQAEGTITVDGIALATV